MPPRKPPKDEPPTDPRLGDESPSGMHRRLEDGSIVEVTSPRHGLAGLLQGGGVSVPWPMLLLLAGAGGAGGTTLGGLLDRDHDDLATAAELRAIEVRIDKIEGRMERMAEDVADTNAILERAFPRFPSSSGVPQ
jgi:hypothetical protein